MSGSGDLITVIARVSQMEESLSAHSMDLQDCHLSDMRSAEYLTRVMHQLESHYCNPVRFVDNV